MSNFLYYIRKYTVPQGEKWKQFSKAMPIGGVRGGSYTSIGANTDCDARDSKTRNYGARKALWRR